MGRIVELWRARQDKLAWAVFLSHSRGVIPSFARDGVHTGKRVRRSSRARSLTRLNCAGFRDDGLERVSNIPTAPLHSLRTPGD